MSDRLEEIKKKHDDVQPTPQTVGDWKDEEWLIAEVERLEARRVPMDEQDKKANQIMRDAVTNMQKQIESLTKKLDNLEKQKRGLHWQQTDALREKVRKLEAENDKLQTDIKLLENRLATVLLELSVSEKARLDAEKPKKSMTSDEAKLAVQRDNQFKWTGKRPRR